MIKFFRQIRKNLLNEGKTSKYFKYAIGEIILVVIGIIIALQINTWNENRINKGRLETYVAAIIKDLENDTLNISLAIKQAENRSATTQAFLAMKNYDSLSIIELEKNLETFYSKVVFSNSTFKKVESSGITNFGEFESLIESYKTYYNQLVPNIMSFEGTHNRAVDAEDNYWRYEQKLYEFTYDEALESFQNKEESKQNLILLLKSPTARNILKIDYRRNKQMIARLQKFKITIVQLIDTSNKKRNVKNL